MKALFKISICSLLLFSSSYSMDQAALMKQIEDLKQRVVQLEGKKALDGSSGLKVNNLGGNSIGGASAANGAIRIPASDQGSIPPEQMKEIQEQMKLIKKQQQESQKYLNELMDNY